MGTESHEQSAYLVALASLIKSIPQTTYVHEMSSVSPTPIHTIFAQVINSFQLMPLLLRGLDLPDTEIRANVIDTFISAVGSEPTDHGAISEHASTLVSTMLKNSMASGMSSVVCKLFHHSRVNSTVSS
jgi:DNA repair/transcription protein MET18/MMS19